MSVYRICSPHSNLVYIGATFQSLKRRWAVHLCMNRRHLKGKGPWVSSFKIIRLGDAFIEHVDSHVFLSRRELLDHEADWQHRMGVDAVNVSREHTYDHNEYCRKWRRANPEKVKAKKSLVRCECGGKYSYRNKHAHFRSKRHVRYSSSPASSLGGLPMKNLGVSLGATVNW